MAYNLGPVKPWVAAAADEIGQRFGIKTIGGWRQSDPFPDHPSGRALDIMTSGATGDQVAAYTIANAERLGVEYLIWNRRYWSGGKWSPYTGSSNPHTDHVHVTFKGTAPKGGGSPVNVGLGDIGDILGGGIGTLIGGAGGVLPGGLTAAMGAAGQALQTMAAPVVAVGDLARKAMWLALPTTQVRIAAGILGVGMLLIGVGMLVKEAR